MEVSKGTRNSSPEIFGTLAFGGLLLASALTAKMMSADHDTPPDNQVVAARREGGAFGALATLSIGLGAKAIAEGSRRENQRRVMNEKKIVVP